MITKGPVRKVSVAPDPTQTLPDYSDVLLDGIMADISADIYLESDDEDDGGEATVSD